MKPPLDGSGGPAGSLRHGFLTPAIRRDLADVNRQFLDLAIEPGLAADPRFALPDEVRQPLACAGEVLLSRVAACPFTLFEVSLGFQRIGAPDRGPGVEDTTRSLIDSALASRTHTFASVAVFLAWRLADGEPLAFRVVLGLAASEELLLNQMRASDLPRLAHVPQLIRPRWIRYPRYWQLLVRAAAAGEATLQRVYCAGICRVVADLNASPQGAGCPRSEPR